MLDAVWKLDSRLANWGGPAVRSLPKSRPVEVEVGGTWSGSSGDDGSDGKRPACNAGAVGSIPGLERFPWRREWLPTLFLPGDFRGQRSLKGYSP